MNHDGMGHKPSPGEDPDPGLITKVISIGLVVALMMSFIGCGNNTNLTIYQSLVSAQSFLTSASAATDPNITKYRVEINQAILAYNALESAFGVYIASGAPSGTAAQQIAAYESALIADIAALTADFLAPVAPVKSAELKQHLALRPQFAWGSLLSILQAAAAIASQVPQAAPWGQLAQIVLSAVQTAVYAATSVNNIDMSVLHPLSLIP